MRRCLIAASLAFTVGITHAQVKTGPADFLIPGPVSAIISVGKWLLDDSTKQRVFVITVRCQDVTEDRAKSGCFKLAVEQTVGSLILTETHVQNNAKLRQDIIEYSSGYVDKYTILNKEVDDGAVQLTMEVTVAESRIADRVLNRTKGTTSIDGDRLSTIAKSFTSQQTQGTAVLNTVAKDFSAQAFNIKVVGTQLVQNYDRSVNMEVGYVMNWNWKYFQSLNAAMAAVAEPVSNAERDAYKGYEVVSWMKAPDAWIVGTRHTHRFRDPAKFETLIRYLVDVAPVIKLEIIDSSGNAVVRHCYAMDLGHYQFQMDKNLLVINGNYIERNVLPVKAIDPGKLQRFQRVTVIVSPRSECGPVYNVY